MAHSCWKALEERGPSFICYMFPSSFSFFFFVCTKTHVSAGFVISSLSYLSLSPFTIRSSRHLVVFFTGLREEQPEESNIRPLVTEFLEVMDLLKNLPEATRSPALLAKLSDQTVKSVRETPVDMDQSQTKIPEGERNETLAITSKPTDSVPADAKQTRAESAPSVSTFCGEEEQTTVC